MTSNELVSVIVPVYGTEPYLDRCVESLVRQSYALLEILLVDDGSPDGCGALCDAWAARDSRVRALHTAHGGVSNARNAGLAEAKGTYIAFVDSDDWVAGDFLERLADALERDGSDIAACAVEMVWEDGRPPEELTVRTERTLDRREAQAALLSETLLKQPVWYKLYRREVVWGIPFPVGKYHEDAFWSYQAVGRAKSVSLVDFVGYFYFQRPGSLMGSGYSLRRLDALEAAERRYAYLAANFPELERAARLSVLDSCLYHGQMALKHLPGRERREALACLDGVMGRYELRREDCAGMKGTRRLWLRMAKGSLRWTCRARNALGVGL